MSKIVNDEEWTNQKLFYRKKLEKNTGKEEENLNLVKTKIIIPHTNPQNIGHEIATEKEKSCFKFYSPQLFLTSDFLGCKKFSWIESHDKQNK